jgi:hypothetical protein
MERDYFMSPVKMPLFDDAFYNEMLFITFPAADPATVASESEFVIHS